MSETKTPKTRPSMLTVIGYALLAATFVAVPAETGPAIADGLHLTGRAAYIGYALAVVFDLVWCAALSKVPAALRQGDRPALFTSLGVAGMGAAASVAGVALYGSMPALAAVPVVALAIHALGMFLADRLADAATDADVLTRQASDRNRLAAARQGARSLSVTRSLAAAARVAELTADHDDHDALTDALTAALAAREVRRIESAATAEKTVSGVVGKHGATADAWAQRGLSLGDADGGPAALPAGTDVTDDAAPIVDAAPAVIESASVIVDAELSAVRSERIALDEDDAYAEYLDVVQSTLDDDVMAVANAAQVATYAADEAAGPRSVTVRVPLEDADTNAQVAPSDRRRTDRAALATGNAARSAERAARLAAIRAEGLDAAATADRFGVALRTARKYVAEANAA